MKRVDTADGGWVDVRERADLTYRQRNMLRAAAIAAGPALSKVPAGAKAGTVMESLGLSFDEADAFTRINEASLAALVEAWSYQHPVPHTIDQAGSIPADLADLVGTAIAAIGADILNNLAPADFSPTPPDQPGPTGPSGASNGSGRAATRIRAKSQKKS